MSELKSKCCGALITYECYDIKAKVNSKGEFLGFARLERICPKCHKPTEVEEKKKETRK